MQSERVSSADLMASPPAPPPDRNQATRPATDTRRRILAGLVAALAALAVLVAFAIAHTFEAFSPFAAAIVVVVSAIAFWGAARADVMVLKNENRTLTARLEALADTAWELSESEERYRSLIDAQGDLVARRAADGTVIAVNAALARALGRPAAAIAGSTLAVLPLAANGEARDMRLDTVDGPRWYSLVDIRVRDEIYSVARDITERKEVEEALKEARRRAEAASQAKSRLLATVSHEFRTPLNGILGLTGLLRETGLTADQETYARAVHSSGEALLTLVDDMLDFSKIEAGRLDVRPEPTDLAALLQDIAELLASRAHAKAIDIAVEIGRDVPARVMVDPARLRQVLINLAGNGVKFTENGGVLLAAKRIASAGPGSAAILFSVSDSGPGIPPEEAERLFGEFEQMDSALSRRHGGAGLGLAISRRIVERLGGALTLEQRLGGGSVFSFVLDLGVREAGLIQAADEMRAASVLILAPDGAEPPVLARTIVANGGSARLARALTEAAGLLGAAAAAGERYDAVLIDQRVAPDAARALALVREAAGAAVPAAILIEPGRRGEVEQMRAAGYGAYLVRPVRRESLLRLVGDLAGHRGEAHFAVDPGDLGPARRAVAARSGPTFDVLLAEDNEINALLARAVLEGMGHHVVEVRDGNAAVAAARAAQYPVILMDLHMPGLDGLAAAREIRAHEKERNLAPAAILAVTADVLDETRAAVAAAGIDRIVEKPMTPDVLRRALAEVTATARVA